MKLDRRSFITSAAAAGLAGSLQACTTNKALGKRVFTGFVSTKDEIEAGRKNHQQFLAEMGGEYSGSQAGEFCRSLGFKMAALTERPNLDYHFSILDDDILNAFAAPGGYLYFSRGMLEMLCSEAELASIVGHELGHVTAQHYARKKSLTDFMMVGVAALAILASKEYNSDVTNVQKALGAFGGLALLKYSRDNEYEADKLGLRYTVKAGYDPQGAITCFEKIDRYSELEMKKQGIAEKVPEFSTTHPRTKKRIIAAQKAALKTIDLYSLTGEMAINRDAYLRRLEGLAHGTQTHNGIFYRDRFFDTTNDFSLALMPDFETRTAYRSFEAFRRDGYMAALKIVNINAIDTKTGKEHQTGTAVVEKFAKELLGRRYQRNSLAKTHKAGPYDVHSVVFSGDALRIPADLKILTEFTGKKVEDMADSTPFRFTFNFIQISKTTLAMLVSGQAVNATTDINAALLDSVRPLTNAEKQKKFGKYIHIVENKKDAWVEDLSQNMAYGKYNADYFNIINELPAGTSRIPDNRLLKTVED